MRIKITILTAISYLLLVISTAYAQVLPKIFIVSPAPGEVILSNTISVLVEIPKNVTLGKDGYLLFWLDTLEHTVENARVSKESQYTFENVPPGLHTLYVELVNADRMPFEPKLAAKVEFETAPEQIKPISNQEGQVEAPPETTSGLFIPPGRGNTALVITLIIAVGAVLWYIFGRPKRIS